MSKHGQVIPKIVFSIQAMRALAVCWVVVNHAYPEVLPGGFIGVDIFFVISGFLISGHLFDKNTTGSFSFSTFYLRRAWRLLPAALFVLISTSILSWVWLPRSWLFDTYAVTSAASIYGANWYLAFTTVNYFADAGVRAPVNHFWSLSVEEQFYFIWPALMWICLRSVWHHPASFNRPRDAGRRIVVVFALLSLLSFCAAEYTLLQNPEPAYFFTHLRAWEFAVGGLAAILLRIVPMRRIPWSGFVTCVCWATLIAAGFTLSALSKVPGHDAVPVVLATGILLWIGDDHGLTRLMRFIRWHPLQTLGDLSYSLYLWHWPLLVIAPFAWPSAPSEDVRAGVAIAAALVLAVLTFHYVEDRLRHNRSAAPRRPQWHILVGFAASSALVGLFAFGGAAYRHGEAMRVAQQLYQLSQDPAPCFGANSMAPGADCEKSYRLADPDYMLQSWDTQIARLPGGTLCQNQLGDDVVKPCTFGALPETASHTIALLGDSHLGMWGAALARFVLEDKIHVVGYIASSCAATLDRSSYASWLLPKQREACRRWREAALDTIVKRADIDVVVVSGAAYRQAIWNGKVREPDNEGSGFTAVWQRILYAGKAVVVIDDIPPLHEKLPVCLAYHNDDERLCGRPRSELMPQTPLANAARKIRSDRFVFMQPIDSFCDEEWCYAVIGGIPAYMDSDHMSAAMARTLAPALREAIMAVVP